MNHRTVRFVDIWPFGSCRSLSSKTSTPIAPVPTSLTI